jgi:phosphoribosyl 1,2-cyclic phosphodiesterase
MSHPGDSYSYKVNDGKHTFIYSTDTELSASDFEKTEENTAYFSGTDLLVIDSQYTLGEAIEKYNWGHSAFSLAVDFAANWNIKHMVLFHHDPAYDDHKLLNILQSAKWYTERLNITGIKLTLAMEDTEIVL